MSTDRYHRQTLLHPIGREGQRRLASADVLLIGCGALGTVVADQLARAGVGSIRIVDRDIVELTNLQRQVLFDESDAADGIPKAVAAAKRLSSINSTIRIEPLVIDFDGEAGERLIRQQKPDVILDGTDNVETRYLVNDLAVKNNLPWVYGAAVGMEGRVMTVRPGVTPCLRCVFNEPPGAGELPTCDTAGVLGAATGIVGSFQALAAIKLLSGNEAALGNEMLTLDLWSNRFRSISLDGARREDCPTCGQHRFEFLERVTGRGGRLCGRNAVQITPNVKTTLDLAELERKLASAGAVQRSAYYLKLTLGDSEDFRLTVFPDGRLIVQGTEDIGRAKSLYARYIGA